MLYTQKVTLHNTQSVILTFMIIRLLLTKSIKIAVTSFLFPTASEFGYLVSSKIATKAKKNLQTQ